MAAIKVISDLIVIGTLAPTTITGLMAVSFADWFALKTTWRKDQSKFFKSGRNRNQYSYTKRFQFSYRNTLVIRETVSILYRIETIGDSQFAHFLLSL